MKTINSICIIGGGTAGWMSAAFLYNKNPKLKITIVDKEVGTPVSVGEATILNFGSFMDQCGFDSAEWFSSIDATYKSGILFPDWVEQGKDVWHPFFMNPTLDSGETSHDAWCKNKDLDFVEYALPMYYNSMENKVDKNEIGAYGFQIDCGKLVEYLRKKLDNKITYIPSEAVEMFKYKNHLVKLLLKNNMEVTSDFFIDCSGWESLLKEPDKIDLTGRLFCDTAIATRVPYNDRKTEMKPYVVSRSVDCGWIWEIPIRTRIGSGLVFNKSITPIEEAKQYLIKHWDNRITEEDLKVLNWTPYYCKNIWEDNIVSIGLSAGFIEPLESTGLALMIDGLQKLQTKIADGTWNNLDKDLYNLEMQSAFEDCIDFVSMHYSKPYKNTPFWNHVRENYTPSERIKSVENTLSKKLLYTKNRKEHHVFSGANWTTWMIQMGYNVNSDSTYIKEISRKNLLRYHERIEKYRSSWSVDHESDISRVELFYELEK